MTNKLTIVHVGCGAMSQAWLEAARQHRHLEVIGLVDLDESLALRRKEEHRLSNAATGTALGPMLKALQPDIVFDCTIPKAHREVTLTALRHGCHVLGEKPMAENLADARRMVAAAKKAGRLYAVIQNRRYNEKVTAFRTLIASGKLGGLTTLHSDFFIGAHFGGFRDSMPHVLLADMAIHTFDMARFISGCDPVSVFCHEWNPKGSWYDHGASAVAIFEMTGGVVFTYRGSWCSEGLHTSWEAEWRAVCENGTAQWNGETGLRAQVVTKRSGFHSGFKDLRVAIRPERKASGHRALINEFVECVRTGATPQTVCTDNIKSLTMVMAAIESAKTGRRVSVKPERA